MSKTFAVISGGQVTNVIVADTQEIAEVVTGQTCVEYTTENPAGIGWTYNSTWNVFGPADLVYEPITQQWITPEEMAAI